MQKIILESFIIGIITSILGGLIIMFYKRGRCQFGEKGKNYMINKKAEV